MTTVYRTGRAALLASLLGTTAVHADVTAQQVWDAFKENLSLYGEASLSIGSETLSGGTLTATDVVMTLSDDETTVTTTLGTMTFTEMGDGTVSVGMPEVTPMTIEVDPTFGTPVTINASVRQEGVTLIVGGTPEAMTYDLTAARYVVGIDGIEGEGADVQVNAAEVAISDVTGAYSVMTGNLQTIDYALDAGSISVAVDITEPGGSGALQFLGTIDGLETAATVALPADMDMEMPETAFVDGLSVDAGYVFGASNYAFAFVDGNDQMQGTASAAGGEMNIAMDASGFSYSGGATAPSVSFSGGDVPFPVEISLAEYGYGISVPLAASDTPEPFGVSLLISELTISDDIWNMLDPGQMLARDPATVSLDVSGLIALAYDVLDPNQMPQMMMSNDLPGEIYELSINDLTVRAAGAEVMGGGAFTFDNSDLATFGGIPRPEGSATLEINGANQLIDTLVQMGLIPEDQVMGARMMMGMFAQVVGDDMMRSQLEVNAEGHVIVNGQRIQ